MKRTSRPLRARRSKKNEVWQPNRRRTKPKESAAKGDKPGGDGSDNGGEKKGRRFLRAALRVVASMVLTVATLLAGFAAYKHATTSDYFAVNDFQIKGMRRLSEDDVLKAAGIGKGTNVFRVDCSLAKEMLEQHPWILAAEVLRRLPRSVDIDVTERVAEAVAVFDVPYLVDDQGEVFKRWVLGDPTPAPVLTGFTREQFSTDTMAVQEKDPAMEILWSWACTRHQRQGQIWSLQKGTS